MLATIEAKWNLPAMTYRDANANTLIDFLDTSHAALAEPPMLTGAGDLTGGETHCDTTDPVLKVLPSPATIAGRLIIRYLGRRKDHKGVRLALHTRKGTIDNLHIALLRKGHVLGHLTVKHVSKHHKHVTLHTSRRLGRGAYTLRVRHGGHTIVRRTIHIR